jgi:hypothetical protein
MNFESRGIVMSEVEQDRREFEAACAAILPRVGERRNPFDLEHDEDAPNEYAWHNTQHAWEIYLAAREKSRAEIASLRAMKLRDRHDELALDPDGDVAVDWATSGGDLLSLSIAPDGSGVFAWNIGGKHGGSGKFSLVPDAFRILHQITTAAIRDDESLTAPGGQENAATECPKNVSGSGRANTGDDT